MIIKYFSFNLIINIRMFDKKEIEIKKIYYFK